MRTLTLLAALVVLSTLSACGQGSRRADPAPAAVDSRGLSLVRSLRDPDWTVRRNAATALGILGDQFCSAVPALTCALDDPHPEVKLAAAAALRRIEEAQSK